MGNCCAAKSNIKNGYHDNPPSVREKIKTLSSDITSPSKELSSDFFEENLVNQNFNSRSSTFKVASVESFNTLKLIGKGSYGKVYLVEQKINKKVYAMKVLKKSAILDEKSKERAMAERDIIMKIRHPFIVTLHYSFQTETKLFFILDFLNGGDLYTYIMVHGKLDWNYKNEYLRSKITTAEIVLALGHLHEKGIVYRDLKPQNIIIAGDGHIKLTDFGLSKANFEQDQTNTIWGTIKYIAPETITGQKYNHMADWWSLGIIVYRMITGELPYPTNKNKEVKKYIAYWEIEVSPKKVRDPIVRDFITKLLNKDPDERLGANGLDEIKNHLFFKGINWEDL